jgi:hypothetical protein
VLIAFAVDFGFAWPIANCQLLIASPGFGLASG